MLINKHHEKIFISVLQHKWHFVLFLSFKMKLGFVNLMLRLRERCKVKHKEIRLVDTSSCNVDSLIIIL